ncbi:MAG: LysR family transcriptional regulator [Minwuiales bacterium]|nr:LysR family transcriptional regulator [Minwuiales bacterium]
MTDGFAWDDIRYFLAASRAATLTQAARSLKVSQPTVGRRLKALETRLGASLFERLPDRLELTEAGRALLPYAHEMERQSADLAQALDRLAAAPDRTVRVTAITSVATFLAGRFGDVERACAPVAVELIGTGERLNLARQEADIALRMNRPPTRGDLVCRKIGQIAYALYGLPETAGGTRFIGFRKNPRKQSQSGWLDDFVRDGQFPLRVNDLHLRLEAARAGVGVTVLPCHLGDADDRLARVREPIEGLTEDIFLLMHESRRDDPAVRGVADAIAETVARHQAALSGIGA